MYDSEKDAATHDGSNPEQKTAVETPARFLNVLAAGNYLGVSKSYLDKLRCSGGGPEYHRHGRRVFYTTEDLDAWSDGKRFSSTSEYSTGKKGDENKK